MDVKNKLKKNASAQLLVGNVSGCLNVKSSAVSAADSVDCFCGRGDPFIRLSMLGRLARLDAEPRACSTWREDNNKASDKGALIVSNYLC